MIKGIKKRYYYLKKQIKYYSLISTISNIIIYKQKRKFLILSFIFGFPEFLLISTLFIDRYELLTHDIKTIILVYLAAIWAWIGPAMIWDYETRILPSFLQKIKHFFKDKKDYHYFKKKHMISISSYAVSRIFIISWISLIVYIYINSHSYMLKFGIHDENDYYWYISILGVAFYSYLTALGFLLAVKTISLLLDLLKYEHKIDFYHHDGKGGFLFVGGFITKTTLMFSTGAVYIPILLELSTSQNNTNLPLIAIIIYVIAIIFSFLLPVYLFHEKISMAKNRYLLKIRKKINFYRQCINQSGNTAYHNYIIYRDDYNYINQFTTWPFDLKNFTTFSASFLLPIILTITQIILATPVK